MFAPCLLHVCSAVALPFDSVRYQPAAKWAKSWTKRHRQALPGSRRTRNSALLIRGFGVQVPGGAPDLTWCFYYLFTLVGGRLRAMFARQSGCSRSWLLGRRVSPLPMVIHSVTSGQKAQAEGLLSMRSRRATRCLAGAVVVARRRLLRLDRHPGAPEVPRRYMPGPSHSVAGPSGLTCARMALAADDQRRRSRWPARRGTRTVRVSRSHARHDHKPDDRDVTGHTGQITSRKVSQSHRNLTIDTDAPTSDSTFLPRLCNVGGTS
jgi:hypothetical protein